MAKQWVKLIEDYKSAKMNEKLGINNSNMGGNRAFIHDTLSYGILDNMGRQPEGGSGIRNSQSGIR